jgi:hypothetical protein
MTFNSVQFNSFQSNFHLINSIQFSPINSVKIYTEMAFNSVQFNNFQSNFHPINSIQFNIINIQITGPGKIKTVINNYRVTGQNQNLLHGNIQLRFTGQNQLLQWWWWRQNQLTMKRPDVACCCWWRGSRQLLMMGKKGDRCRRAAVDEDWRGSSKPWVVEEIVIAVDEKEAATVSIDDWTLEWRLEWGKRRSEDWTVTVIAFMEIVVVAFVVARAQLVN